MFAWGGGPARRTRPGEAIRTKRCRPLRWDATGGRPDGRAETRLAQTEARKEDGERGMARRRGRQEDVPVDAPARFGQPARARTVARRLLGWQRGKTTSQSIMRYGEGSGPDPRPACGAGRSQTRRLRGGWRAAGQEMVASHKPIRLHKSNQVKPLQGRGGSCKMDRHIVDGVTAPFVRQG